MFYATDEERKKAAWRIDDFIIDLAHSDGAAKDIGAPEVYEIIEALGMLQRAIEREMRGGRR